MARKRMRKSFMITSGDDMEVAERTAALPEEMKERERPYYSIMKAILRELDGDNVEANMYAYCGGVLETLMYLHPDDPLMYAKEHVEIGE